MSPPSSDLFKVEVIPNAGRGVIAAQAIPKDTLILKSGPPATHILFREYRKEICAHCFYYDRGRTLPSKLPNAGKVFCSGLCKDAWLQEQGSAGLRAWETLNVFVQSKSKNISNSHGLPGLGPKPDSGTISDGWDKYTRMSRLDSECKKIAEKQHIDPDLLGYLLSCMLRYYFNPEQWEQEVLALAMDTQPYRSQQDFDAYLNSFMQLTHLCQLDNLLTTELLLSCSAATLHNGVAAASHNSFGIRDEDGEEYMGYGLYPVASYFNHSCNPNVSKKRIGREWVFTAKRDIAAGEECCITYLGGDEDELTTRERRERTKEHWGFECMCGRCQEDSQHQSTLFAV